ncbi:MAG TPA: hypothetical protein VE177_00295 [Candidatus Binatus sp.]|nr:hypothetical protein [Candidatus Binatus sp.]
MSNDQAASDEVSIELDQHIIETIRDQCLQLGITDYNPSTLRWSWLPVRELTFERPPEVKGGELVLFKGLRDALKRDDWAPVLLCSLIRGQKSKGNTKRAITILTPIIAFLVAMPILFTSSFPITNGSGVVTSTPELGGIIDLALALPLLFSGAIIYSILRTRQRLSADQQAVEMLGKQSLLDSLRTLQAYFKTTLAGDNAKKIDQLATEEFQHTTNRNYKIMVERSLIRGQDEVRKRIQALERPD